MPAMPVPTSPAARSHATRTLVISLLAVGFVAVAAVVGFKAVEPGEGPADAKPRSDGRLAKISQIPASQAKDRHEMRVVDGIAFSMLCEDPVHRVPDVHSELWACIDGSTQNPSAVAVASVARDPAYEDKGLEDIVDEAKAAGISGGPRLPVGMAGSLGRHLGGGDIQWMTLGGRRAVEIHLPADPDAGSPSGTMVMVRLDDGTLFFVATMGEGSDTIGHLAGSIRFT
jgi:hypothetical protein